MLGLHSEVKHIEYAAVYLGYGISCIMGSADSSGMDITLEIPVPNDTPVPLDASSKTFMNARKSV
jgi:hypothetical protein